MIDKQTNFSESKFWRFVNLAGNALGANMLFILCCIPIITIGPATCGLYSAVRYLIRKDSWFQGFWEGFKKNFVRTALAGIVCVGMMVYLLLNFNLALNFYVDTGAISPAVVYGVAMLFPTLIAAALWPLNIYIPYDFSDWLKNAVNLIVKAPYWVLASAVLWWAPVFLILYYLDITLGFLIVFIAVYFTLTVFVSTIVLKNSLIDFLEQYRLTHPQEEEL